MTGTESVQHPFSDSDGDSDIENYRIKSILRGKTPLVYVKGAADGLVVSPPAVNDIESNDKQPPIDSSVVKIEQDPLKDDESSSRETIDDVIGENQVKILN